MNVSRAWLDLAACRDVPHDVFFTDGGGPGVLARAREVCGACPVRGTCLADALRWPALAQFGFRGGMTAQERQTVVRARRGALAVEAAR